MIVESGHILYSAFIQETTARKQWCAAIHPQIAMTVQQLPFLKLTDHPRTMWVGRVLSWDSFLAGARLVSGRCHTYTYDWYLPYSPTNYDLGGIFLNHDQPRPVMSPLLQKEAWFLVWCFATWLGWGSVNGWWWNGISSRDRLASVEAVVVHLPFFLGKKKTPLFLTESSPPPFFISVLTTPDRAALPAISLQRNLNLALWQGFLSLRYVGQIQILEWRHGHGGCGWTFGRGSRTHCIGTVHGRCLGRRKNGTKKKFWWPGFQMNEICTYHIFCIYESWAKGPWKGFPLRKPLGM